MQILVVSPGESPVITEIDGSLQAMQKIIGGTFFLCGALSDNERFTSLTLYNWNSSGSGLIRLKCFCLPLKDN